MLIELGFRCPDAIYREWKRRGYLIVSHERGHERTQYSTRFNGRQMRLIAIRMAALDAAGDAAAEVVLPPTASSGNNSSAAPTGRPPERISVPPPQRS
jgi:hypothetical protein